MDIMQGKVTIAPAVLATIVRLTALEQRGVRRLAAAPRNVRGLLAGMVSDEGILLDVVDGEVHVELHVVADADANMLRLGETLQNEVSRAIEEMVGMRVRSVDVYIDDVMLPATGARSAG